MTNINQVKDLYRTLLGREASDAEAQGWLIPWDQAFYGIKDSPEGKAWAKREAENAANAAKVPALQDQVANQQKQIDELSKQVKDLQAQLASAGEDTRNLNILGVSLQWLIKRLGLK